MFLIVASLCSWQGAASAQPAPGAVPEGWLASAVLAAGAQAAGPAGPAAENRRWFTAGQNAAWVAPVEAESTPVGPAAPSYHDYFHALGYSFTHGLAAREQLAPLAIGSAATLALLPIDHKVSDSVRGEATRFGHVADVVGGPLTMTALGGGLILGSLATDDVRFRSCAFTLSQGLIVAASVSAAFKFAVPRNRPDGSSRFSFPSGHAAGTFALAAVSSHYYGAKAGVPLYVLATLVSFSRVTYGKHFPSDVIAGAAIGYISARAAILGTEHVAPAPSDGSRALPGVGGLTFCFRF